MIINQLTHNGGSGHVSIQYVFLDGESGYPNDIHRRAVDMRARPILFLMIGNRVILAHPAQGVSIFINYRIQVFNLFPNSRVATGGQGQHQDQQYYFSNQPRFSSLYFSPYRPVLNSTGQIC